MYSLKARERATSLIQAQAPLRKQTAVHHEDVARGVDVAVEHRAALRVDVMHLLTSRAAIARVASVQEISPQ